MNDRSATEEDLSAIVETSAGVSVLAPTDPSSVGRRSTPPPLPRKLGPSTHGAEDGPAEKESTATGANTEGTETAESQRDARDRHISRNTPARPPQLPSRRSGSKRWPIIDTRIAHAYAGRRWTRVFTPWTVSLLLHLTLILVAGCLLMPIIMADSERVVVVGFAKGDAGDKLEEMERLCELDGVSELDEVTAVVTLTSVDVDSMVDGPSSADLAALELAVDPADSVVMPAAFLFQEVATVNVGRPAAGKLREAGSVEDAVDAVVTDIRRRLEHSDLLVAWLFDSSISLLDDRRRVAQRLAGMFDAIRAGAPSHKLRNAAVAFGGASRSLVGPTTDGSRIVEAVSRVPVDRSGTENVLTAVESVVNRYAKRSQQGVMVVVWTDESGDDLDRLEDVIHVCRQYGVSVSVVGPSAMLSRRVGTHVFRDPTTGQAFSLPIVRGPDAAVDQRLHLPYWYGAKMPGWAGMMALGPTGLPPWYGGGQMERLSSGFGPYALTRLALSTGGTFTVLDHADDRGPFRLEFMRPYQPDYRRASLVAADVESHPLRRAVLDVVAKSHDTKGLDPPATTFFVSRTNGPKGPELKVYYPPARFQSKLRSEMRRRETLAKESIAAVQSLLSPFGPEGMEECYQQETSPRWRAWYDLTRGRLLAIRVRNAEYAILADLLTRRSAVASHTNHIVLVPNNELRGSEDVQALAAEAERLLNRCMRENPLTPWAYLAQRELDHPFGIDVRQVTLPPPVPVPGGMPMAPAGPAPQINLPQL